MGKMQPIFCMTSAFEAFTKLLKLLKLKEERNRSEGEREVPLNQSKLPLDSLIFPMHGNGCSKIDGSDVFRIS